mgnify:CR=1 FL=1
MTILQDKDMSVEIEGEFVEPVFLHRIRYQHMVQRRLI